MKKQYISIAVTGKIIAFGVNKDEKAIHFNSWNWKNYCFWREKNE